MNYRALRILASVYKMVAWIIFGAGSIISLSMLFSSNIIASGLGIPITPGASIATALIFEGFILIQFVFFLGLGQLISLVFDIDFNTRPVTEEVLEKKEEITEAA